VESLFRNLKHGFGLKEAWQQSRQALMRWVSVLAAGYAINQMLAFTDPAHLAGLAEPAPWRAPGSRTAGLIPPSPRRSGEKSAPLAQAQTDPQRRSTPKPHKSPDSAIVVPATWL
jgi:hypothetical protein